MNHSYEQFVAEYEQWLWETWPTAVIVNQELRELSEI